MTRFWFFILLILLGFEHAVQARVFDFKDDNVATYIRGTYGNSLVGGDAYANSSGSGNTTDNTVQANYSGEFGLLFGSGAVNFRIGGEFLLPSAMGSVTGSNASGVNQFTLNSKLTAVMAMGSLEFALRRRPTSKVLFIIGGGYAWINLTNSYTMTAAGTTASGLQNFTETSSATDPVIQSSLAYEFLFTDNATLALELGYRYLPVNNLNYSGNQTTYQGSVNGGSPLLNNNGSNRTINLGGPFAGISLRFYFH